MTPLEPILAHLEFLRRGAEADDAHARRLEPHIVDDWIRDLRVTRQNVCEVVALWLADGFHSRRLDFDFADQIANDLHYIVQADAPSGTSNLMDWHTPLTWEVYLAFDAGEYTPEPGRDPIEENTRPLVAALMERVEELATWRPALAVLDRGAAR